MARGRSAPVGLERARESALYALSRPGSAAADHRALRASGRADSEARIAIREADAALTFGELWDGVSGLAETLAAETKPGDLIGILLPAGPMFPLAMLACLASGRPFVALDTHSPPDWLDHVLRDARPTLIITLQDGLRECRGSDANAARHPSDGPAPIRAHGLAAGHHGRGRTRVCPVHVRQHRAAKGHRQQPAEPAAARRSIDQRRAYQHCGPIADSRVALHDRRRPRHLDRAAGRRQHSPPRPARRRRAGDHGVDPRRRQHHPVRLSGASAIHRRGSGRTRGQPL